MTDQPLDDAGTNELQNQLFEMFVDDEEFVGTALAKEGSVTVILALVTSQFDAARLPKSLGGVAVRSFITGTFEPDAADLF